MTQSSSNEPTSDARTFSQDMTSVRGGSISVHQASWASGDLLLARKEVIAADAELFCRATHHTLILTLAGTSARSGAVNSDGSRYEGVDRPGALTFFPAGSERRSWQQRSRLDVACLLIDPSSPILAYCGVDPNEIGSFTNGCDPLTELVMSELAARLKAGVEPLMADHATALILARLDRRRRASREPNREQPWLSAAQVSRAVALIEEGLSEPVRLAEVASAAGVSVRALAHGFRQAMGVPPYAYLLQARIARAKSLMAGSSLPLAEISFACGFSSQSQMTRHFKMQVGMTPSRYRQELSGRNRQD